MSERVLFWHRRDLRASDNIGLAAAHRQSERVVGAFCFDPALLGPAVAPARVAYLLGCLRELQQRYWQAGSELLVLYDDPSRGIPALAAAIGASAVFWNWDIEPYARARDRAVGEALHERGIAAHGYWDQLLHAPGEIRTQSSSQPYTVFGPFARNWQRQPKAAPAAALEAAQGLSEQERRAAQAAGARSLPSERELGFSWRGELPLAPGEAAARQRLTAFCDRALGDYGWQRDFPAVEGTSQLSAALKLGAIGIREVWQAASATGTTSRSEEASHSVQAWQQELAWREFYQHALYFFPKLADGPYRRVFVGFPWDNDPERFAAWCAGQTGYPIVDAAMRQLNAVGWMHNRCRMIVANFLTKDLLVDWRWGERYFMQALFDGDLAANNGGWQWSTSCGLDPKPLRVFNPTTQARKFDPEGEYVRAWVPELRSLEPEALVSGNIPEAERDRCGYPPPIVDHHQQQRTFKARYQQQKAAADA
ncbi:MAG: deoxyribodipyrimidine photolyase [Cyanobacteria bacterium QS_8_64_29]|nr:MAG: deoxyribodipyrimidine photolyase [Cyanobacteria bacterium QS_8_64_29]